MLAGLRSYLEMEKPAIMYTPHFLSAVSEGTRPKLPREANTLANRTLLNSITRRQQEDPETFAVLVED